MKTALIGATVVDGTQAPGRKANVVIEGDRIISVGPESPPEDAEIIDLSGLVLAPGFIDPHTHLDCQIFWDSDLTPSCWHGVTTVVMGNCGFTIAPTREKDRDTIIRTLENVEGMSVAALQAGIEWDFETFPEYLNSVDRRDKRINVGAMIGHSALRLYVMGDSSTKRAAEPEEVARMKGLVGEAMNAGALGFSTSQLPLHIGAGGAPVPSRLAKHEEIFEISSALTEAGAGTIAVAAGVAYGSDFSPEVCADLSRTSGRPLTWLGLSTGLMGEPGGAKAAIKSATEMGGEVLPQISCRPMGAQITLSDFIPLIQISKRFADLPPLSEEERLQKLRSPEWREQVREDMSPKWKDRLLRVTVDETELHSHLTGQTLAEVAAGRGGDVLDAMLDLSIEENLVTRFKVILANDNEEELGELLDDDRCIIGLSDAGAHLDVLCDAVYPTYLLSHWVRDKKSLSLEKAVWRLTEQPARLFGIKGRGRIAEGYYADLVAFDADTVGPQPLRRVWDLPAKTDRLLAGSVGMPFIWVNGEAIRRDGKDIENVYPGQLVTPSDA